LDFSENTTFKFHKVVKRYYSGEIGNITKILGDMNTNNFVNRSIFDGVIDLKTKG